MRSKKYKRKIMLNKKQSIAGDDCIDASLLVVGILPGCVWVSLKEESWGYDGTCPRCSSNNIRDKGSYDKCNDCDFEINFYNLCTL